MKVAKIILATMLLMAATAIKAAERADATAVSTKVVVAKVSEVTATAGKAAASAKEAKAATRKGDWKGKVVDEAGEPVAYANVAVLAKADSAVVCGTVTEEDGTF